jgi:putative addiction module component (TIGR02574 family)
MSAIDDLRSNLAADTVLVMSKPVAQIQRDISSLTLKEKEELLHSLLSELNGPPDHGVEAAWLAEVERREREIDAGAVKCIPANEVFARLDKILGR